MNEGIFNIDSVAEEEPILKTEITLEDIQDIEFSKGEDGVDGIMVVVEGKETFLPREQWQYKGEGATSYSSKYVEKKKEYIKTFGIKTEDLDEEQVTTLTLMLHYITVPLEMMLDGGNIEDIERALKTTNALLEERLDKKGTRAKLSTGKTFQDYRNSANAKDLVTVEEFNELLGRVLTAFPRKNTSEMV